MVHGSWFMVHGNELSTMNYERAAFLPPLLISGQLQPPLCNIHPALPYQDSVGHLALRLGFPASSVPSRAAVH